MISPLANVAGTVLGLYARLLRASVRLQIVGEDNLQPALSDQRAVIFAGWHGQTHLLYPLIAGCVDMSRMVMMVVGDERAVTLTRFAKTVGITTFPVAGDDQSMSGARNFLRLVRLLQGGRYSYMTPDGPNGPARVAKEGVAFLAERAGALVIALGAFTRSCYRLPRWDRYALPLPFSRVYTSVRPAIPVERGADHSQLLRSLSVEMDAAVQEARRAAGA